jgi:hypothetical protein
MTVQYEWNLSSDALAVNLTGLFTRSVDVISNAPASGRIGWRGTDRKPLVPTLTLLQGHPILERTIQSIHSGSENR